MYVEIVQPNDGWIVHRMAQAIQARVEGVRLVEKATGRGDVTYFMPYSTFKDTRGRTMALFTHREEMGHWLHNWWTTVAERVDHCVAMTGRYMGELPAEKSTVILPGVDERYSPRKLRVGVAGKLHKGNSWRKGKDLLDRLGKEKWIELTISGGGMEPAMMPGWYRGLDVYLVASRIEGGPMGAIEAAACGVPVVAADVGFTALVPGVKLFLPGDYEAMIGLLREFYGDPGAVRAEFSWDRWAEEHQALFEKVAAVAAVRV